MTQEKVTLSDRAARGCNESCRDSRARWLPLSVFASRGSGARGSATQRKFGPARLPQRLSTGVDRSASPSANSRGGVVGRGEAEEAADADGAARGYRRRGTQRSEVVGHDAFGT